MGVWVKALVLAVLLCGNAFAINNAKEIDSMKAMITQEGSFRVIGSIDYANITVYIPQIGKSINVSAKNWSLIKDSYENTMVLMQWHRPIGTINYSVSTIVENTATNISLKYPVGFSSKYIKPAYNIILTDEAKSIVPETTWKGIAEAASNVRDMLFYNSSLVGARKSSEWALENRQGVCVEHANLLAAALRANYIPVRYVTGYAYNILDNKLMGHTWVEVLASNDQWVPFDPTWLQGAYLDASHIPTSYLMDDSQSDKLNFLGQGKIIWNSYASNATDNLFRDKVQVLSMTSKKPTKIELSSSVTGRVGYVKAVIKYDRCYINSAEVVGNCRPANKNKPFLSCSNEDQYWFFENITGPCVINIIDSFGSVNRTVLQEDNSSAESSVFIYGPDSVSKNQPFKLKASAGDDYIFYSPEKGRSYEDTWDLKLSDNASFYLYSNGKLYKKTVAVAALMPVTMAVSHQKTAVSGEPLQINITMVSGEDINGTISAKLGMLTFTQDVYLKKGIIKQYYISFIPAGAGDKNLIIEMKGRAKYSGPIHVVDQDSLLSPIYSLINNMYLYIQNNKNTYK